ncbi:MAG: TSUP family transporter [Burkholderiaceae bacterium]
MSWGTDLLLFVAALLAGVLNAMAGGGTFITFPALVWAGVPPVAANATSTLAAFPGYASSSWGFRGELAALPRRTVMIECSMNQQQ